MKISSKLKLAKNLTIALCCAIFTVNLMASPLSDAKDAGLIEEVSDGYVVALGTATAEIDALVESINERRKAAYEKIARETGITAKQVGQESYAKRHPPKE